MNLKDLSQRQLYKFTGPPENWLTAIKFMTWGLEEKYLNRWQEIEPGDIFLMHSTSTHTIVKGAPSSVIGFGVVSPEFSKKPGPLWLQEIEERKNIWPLLVPFSEIYLFSELRPQAMLEAPTAANTDLIFQESKELLSNASRLPEGFPQMGSISSVRPEIVARIFNEAGRFYLYEGKSSVTESYYKPTQLREIKDPKDIMRKPVTLSNLDEVKKKTIKLGTATYSKDLQTMERAEAGHHETLSFLFELLKSLGYETLYNRHVDLFAVKDGHSFLFEVKSLANKNFKAQARKGIVQLFEYEYFEIQEFLEERKLKTEPNKALIFSQEPPDMNYIQFINSLKMGAGYFSERKLQSSGQKATLAGLTK